MGSIFIRGFCTGMILQFAIGPVFIFVMNLSIQRSRLDGLAAVMGVTSADYVYIALSIIGIGKLLENDRVKKVLGIIAPSVLLVFGVIMLYSAYYTYSGRPPVVSGGVSSSFMSAFIMTISSPLTILFWSGLFASKAVEYNLTRKGLVVFGLAAGCATIVFLGSGVCILSSVAEMIPTLAVAFLNGVVAVLLIGYGVTRLYRAVSGFRASCS